MNPILARKSVAVTALVGLLGMTGYVIMQPFNGLDHSLQQAIGQLQSPFLTSVMKLVSTIGNPAIVLVVMAVLAVVFWRKQQRFESTNNTSKTADKVCTLGNDRPVSGTSW